MSDKIVTIGARKERKPHPDFPIGAVIQLKSGGHPMTVRTSSDNVISADWFNDLGDLTTAEFSPAMLCEFESELQIEIAPGSEE